MATSGKNPDPEWQRHKATIHRLYISEKKKLSVVMYEMETFHGFSASKYQYTSMFTTWGFKKNTKSEDWKGIGGSLKRRHLEASAAVVWVRDSPVPLKKLKKELQRHTAQEDALLPTTPEAVMIQPIIDHNPAKPCPILRSLTISLPWHDYVDDWIWNLDIRTASPSKFPAASSIQKVRSDLASLFPELYNVNSLHGLMAPVPWGGAEPPSFGGIAIRDVVRGESRPSDRTPLQLDVVKCFGIELERPNSNPEGRLDTHLRPYVIERQPEETRRAAQELMDPYSMASMQILMSYMALLLSNDLIEDHAVQAFLAKAEEMHYLGNLIPLFTQGSPSARAIATRLLHAAVHANSPKFLREALRSGADVESPSTGGCTLTLLQDALQSNRNELARILIDAGADVNAGSSARYRGNAYRRYEEHVEGFTCYCEVRGLTCPVTLAARSDACVDLIPELVRKGAIVPKQNPVLIYAVLAKASVSTISCLISAGADINICFWPERRAWNSPLSAAARQTNLHIVQILLKAGADPNDPLKSEIRPSFSPDRFNDGGFETPLFCAIEYGNKQSTDFHDIVRLLLEYGADPNVAALEFISEIENGTGVISDEVKEFFWRWKKDDWALFYPLQSAVRLGSIELVELLLEYNASVNTVYGTHALALAILQGNNDMVRLLLGHGADPNGLSGQPHYRSALEAAVDSAKLELIDLLLEFGADVNNRPASHGGRTPLQRAAENGAENVIEHLLKRGASMVSQPAPVGGTSVLEGFVRNGLHIYVSEALRAGASPDRISLKGSSPLVIAVLHGDAVSLKILLAAGANVHEYVDVSNAGEVAFDLSDEFLNDDDKSLSLSLSPIQWAAFMGREEIFKLLCEAEANVNQPPCRTAGYTALYLAARYDEYVTVQLLLEQKAEVGTYSNGRTALGAAIEGGSDRIVKLLLDNGADPNQPSLSRYILENSTPLCIACDCVEISVIHMLLHASADVNQGYAVWSIITSVSASAGQKKEILEILLQYKADVNKRYSHRGTPLQEAIVQKEFHCADILIRAGADVNAVASTGVVGRTALQAAISVGSVEMVERLLLKGADVNAVASAGGMGRTALQAAAEVGNVEMVERLLLGGADVNAPAEKDYGVTALQAAAIKGYLRIAQILLEHGAVIDAAACSGRNEMMAIDGAASFGRIDMVKLLLDNYDGPTSISTLRNSAYEAAKKKIEWFVMQMLTTYKYPSEAWSEEVERPSI